MNLIYMIAILAAGYYLYQWYDSREENAQRSFEEEIVHQSAEWLAPHVGLSLPETADALEHMLTTGERPEALERLQRIDYDVVKETADRALRLVHIQIRGEGEPHVGEVHRRMGWSSLPEKVRDRFLVHGGDRQTFALYPKK